MICKTYFTYHQKKDEVFEMHNQIKKFREHKGISQGKLAEMCNVSRQTINAIENNKYDPSLELAFSIAFILDSTVDTLFIYQKTYRK
jgi:putative transcriptional regulator